jgi:hypothetical protein
MYLNRFEPLGTFTSTQSFQWQANDEWNMLSYLCIIFLKYNKVKELKTNKLTKGTGEGSQGLKPTELISACLGGGLREPSRWGLFGYFIILTVNHIG